MWLAIITSGGAFLFKCFGASLIFLEDINDSAENLSDLAIQWAIEKGLQLGRDLGTTVKE